MSKFIKIIDKNIAENLKNAGFDYVIDHVGTETMYSFLYSSEIEKLLQSKYHNTQVVISNRLCF